MRARCHTGVRACAWHGCGLGACTGARVWHAAAAAAAGGGLHGGDDSLFERRAKELTAVGEQERIRREQQRASHVGRQREVEPERGQLKRVGLHAEARELAGELAEALRRWRGDDDAHVWQEGSTELPRQQARVLRAREDVNRQLRGRRAAKARVDQSDEPVRRAVARRRQVEARRAPRLVATSAAAAAAAR
eukprot:4315295-Prymnesium_polylepis.1